MYIYDLRAIPKGDVCLGCQGKLLSFGNFPNLGFLKSKLKKKDLCDFLANKLVICLCDHIGSWNPRQRL